MKFIITWKTRIYILWILINIIDCDGRSCIVETVNEISSIKNESENLRSNWLSTKSASISSSLILSLFSPPSSSSKCRNDNVTKEKVQLSNIGASKAYSLAPRTACRWSYKLVHELSSTTSITTYNNWWTSQLGNYFRKVWRSWKDTCGQSWGFTKLFFKQDPLQRGKSTRKASE